MSAITAARCPRVCLDRGLVPRKARNLIAEALSDTRVVTLNGARQAGKSTLARLAAQAQPEAVIRLLDDPATLRAARDDPAGFVEHDGLMVIDEVRLAPELFRSIKVAVDTDPRPGRFLLTGSAQVLALRQLPDALPGRMEIIELWPFSQGEITRSSTRPSPKVPRCPGPQLCASATTSNGWFAAVTPRRSAVPPAATRPSSTPT
jgi:predicted AAA+ superfamily ATPase